MFDLLRDVEIKGKATSSVSLRDVERRLSEIEGDSSKEAQREREFLTEAKAKFK